MTCHYKFHYKCRSINYRNAYNKQIPSNTCRTCKKRKPGGWLYQPFSGSKWYADNRTITVYPLFMRFLSIWHQNDTNYFSIFPNKWSIIIIIYPITIKPASRWSSLLSPPALDSGRNKDRWSGLFHFFYPESDLTISDGSFHNHHVKSLAMHGSAHVSDRFSSCHNLIISIWNTFVNETERVHNSVVFSS